VLCLKTYGKEPFDPQGWRPLCEESTRVFSEMQIRALAAMYEWRDTTARANDESTRYARRRGGEAGADVRVGMCCRTRCCSTLPSGCRSTRTPSSRAARPCRRCCALVRPTSPT
jgi:hypothetical protein